MDAEKDVTGKLLQERSNGVYAPTTVQKVSFSSKHSDTYIFMSEKRFM